MQQYVPHVLCFGLAFIFSLIFTPISRLIAERLGAIDMPSARRVHKPPMPRLGGIGIFAGTVFALLLSLVLSDQAYHAIVENRPTQVFGLLGCAAFIFAIGFYDDVRGLRARHKLLAQIIGAVALCYFGYRMDLIVVLMSRPVNIGVLLGTLLTVLWCVGVPNAINLIDGIDGLAGGVAACGALTLFVVALSVGTGHDRGRIDREAKAAKAKAAVVLAIDPAEAEQYADAAARHTDMAGKHADMAKSSGVTALIAVALLGGTLGFLCFNFNPASVFMGDSGSLFLGFMLAGIGITAAGIGITEDRPVSPPGGVGLYIPIMALALPLLDALFAIIRRLWLGAPPFQPDRAHVHHKLLNMGFSVRTSVVLLYGVAILLGVAATRLADRGPRVALWYYLVIGGVALWLLRVITITKIRDLPKVFREGQAFRAKRNAQMEMVHDAGRKFAAAKETDTLWLALVDLVERLGYDHVAVTLNDPVNRMRPDDEQAQPDRHAFAWTREGAEPPADGKEYLSRSMHRGAVEYGELILNKVPPDEDPKYNDGILWSTDNSQAELLAERLTNALIRLNAHADG